MKTYTKLVIAGTSGIILGLLLRSCLAGLVGAVLSGISLFRCEEFR